MANVKISELDPTDPLTGPEVVEVVQAGMNKRTTAQAIANLKADPTGAAIKAAYEAEDDTNAYADVDKAKVDNLTITAPVDLDAMKTRVNQLDAAVILMGGWDASIGTFPAAGAAQTGQSWIVSVGGTVDGIEFSVNDRVVAIVDNAADDTYAANWLKMDYTDQVLSVGGNTGAISNAQLKASYEANGDTNAFTDLEKTKLSGIESGADITDAANVGAAIHGSTGKATPVDADTLSLIDSAAGNILKKLTWANLKATIKSYYDSLATTLTNKTIAFASNTITGLPVEIGIALSDESTALTTGLKVTIRMPFAATLVGVRLGSTTAPTGAALIVDVKEAGATLFSTKPRIDATTKTSTTSGTPAVISDAALADDAEVTFHIDQIGSTIAGAGLKCWLLLRRA